METNEIELFALYLEDMREHLQLLNESLLLLDKGQRNRRDHQYDISGFPHHERLHGYSWLFELGRDHS